MGRIRYRIEWGKEKVKTIFVDERVHFLVKNYAREHRITITEATYSLLGKALAMEEGLNPRGGEKG